MSKEAKEEDFVLDEKEVNEKDLAAMDKAFLSSIEQRTADSCASESNNAFTFWVLIILLLLFIFLIVFGALMVVRSRRRRYEYAELGYY